MTPQSNAPLPADDFELDALLGACARFLLESPEPDTFLSWLALAGPDIAPTIAATATTEEGASAPAFRALGAAIYNAMPLPEHGFRPGKLRLPGRNEPCICGSGRKYKQCCRSAVTIPDFRQANLLSYVLTALPVTRFPALPDACKDLVAVADTALQWVEDGHATRAVALIEPWFAGDGPLSAAVELLADALMTVYGEQDRPHRQDWLIEQLLSRGDRPLRAMALRHRSLLSARRDDFQAAWKNFEAARSLAPSDPLLAITELPLLLLEGNLAGAKQRADYWMTRLERRHAQVDDSIFDLVYDVQHDPEAVRAELRGETHPRLAELGRLLAAAPLPAAHFRVIGRADRANGQALEPDAGVRAVESAWADRYDPEKPLGAALGIDDDRMWSDAAPWLEFLAREPLAWQSFTVLDDLVLAVDLLPQDDTTDAVLDGLLARSLALLDANLAGGGPAPLPWASEPNQPALRLLAQAAYREIDRAEQEGVPGERFTGLAERLLGLNPDDDFGVLEWLRTARPEPTAE